MATVAYTVAFEGIDARLVEVQCAVTPGIPAFTIVCSIKLTFDLMMAQLKHV
jgi:hypothetical protein